MKVLKRITLYVLAVLGLILIVLIVNLDSFKQGFKRGYERQDAIELAKAFAEDESVQSMLPLQANETTTLIALTSEENRAGSRTIAYLVEQSIDRGRTDRA